MGIQTFRKILRIAVDCGLQLNKYLTVEPVNNQVMSVKIRTNLTGPIDAEIIISKDDALKLAADLTEMAKGL